MHANPATTIICAPFWTPTACASLTASLSDDAWKPGHIAVPGAEEDVGDAMRSCQLNDAIAAETLSALEARLLEIGRGVFGFELTGFRDDDPVTVMRYTAPGDHFVWHIDNGLAAAPFGTRKLSFSVQLSPPDAYRGGDLEFALYSEGYGAHNAAQAEAARQQGTLILFPAFHLHRVSPVTEGTRDALVGWLHGPAFR